MKKLVKKVKAPRHLPAPKKVAMPETTEGLLSLLRDPQQWDDDDDRPERAVAVLAARGESALVAEAFVKLVRTHDDEDVLGAIAAAVGAHVDVDVEDGLCDAIAADERGWRSIVEVLVAFAERGRRSERLWPWLERVRGEEPGLWCVYAAACGDARVVPLLQRMCDDAEAGLAAGDADAAYAVIDVVEALGEFDAVRDVDEERRRRAVELHREWQRRVRRQV